MIKIKLTSTMKMHRILTHITAHKVYSTLLLQQPANKRTHSDKTKYCSVVVASSWLKLPTKLLNSYGDVSRQHNFTDVKIWTHLAVLLISN